MPLDDPLCNFLLDFSHFLVDPLDLFVPELILMQVERLPHVYLHDFERLPPNLREPRGILNCGLEIFVELILEFLQSDSQRQAFDDDRVVRTADRIFVVLIGVLNLIEFDGDEDQQPNQHSRHAQPARNVVEGAVLRCIIGLLGAQGNLNVVYLGVVYCAG